MIKLPNDAKREEEEAEGMFLHCSCNEQTFWPVSVQRYLIGEFGGRVGTCGPLPSLSEEVEAAHRERCYWSVTVALPGVR